MDTDIEKDMPKVGDGAPLHGIPKQIMHVLNMALSLAVPKMIMGLAHKLGFGQSGPALANQAATPNATPTVQPIPGARPVPPGLGSGPKGPTQ